MRRARTTNGHARSSSPQTLVTLGAVFHLLMWRLVNDNPIQPGLRLVDGQSRGSHHARPDRHPRHGHLHPVPHRWEVAAQRCCKTSDSNIRLDDVVGADQTKREAIDGAEPVPHVPRRSSAKWAATLRRGVLFEGPPGTGKTYLAKAMAAEAAVPFLLRVGERVPVDVLRPDEQEDPVVLQGVAQGRTRGGAIGYIEEFDAIGGARSGMNSGWIREGIVGVVNELLVQMQSFDLPTGRQKFKASFIDWFNSFLPADRRRPRRQGAPRPTS